MTPQMHPSLQILPGYDLVDAKVISVVLLYHRSLIRKLATATSAFRFPIADRDDKTATRKNLGRLVHWVAFFERATKRDCALPSILPDGRDEATIIGSAVNPHAQRGAVIFAIDNPELKCRPVLLGVFAHGFKPGVFADNEILSRWHVLGG